MKVNYDPKYTAPHQQRPPGTIHPKLDAAKKIYIRPEQTENGIVKAGSSSPPTQKKFTQHYTSPDFALKPLKNGKGKNRSSKNADTKEGRKKKVSVRQIGVEC